MKRFSAKNKVMRVAVAVLFFLLTIGFLFLSVDFVAYNKSFYKNQFKKNKAAEEVGLSQSELDRVMDGLIAYFSGKNDELQIHVLFDGFTEPEPFYTEDELLHMEDVKKVFLLFKIMSVVFLSVSLVGLAALTFFTESGGRISLLSRGAVTGCAVLFALLLILGVLLLFFFEPVFTIFHHIFFPQGNWQFPWDSNMLAILPSSLFMEAAIYIAISGLLFVVLTFAAGLTGMILSKRNAAKKADTAPQKTA